MLPKYAYESTSRSDYLPGSLTLLVFSQYGCLTLVAETSHQLCIIQFAFDPVCWTGGQCRQQNPDPQAALSEYIKFHF